MSKVKVMDYIKQLMSLRTLNMSAVSIVALLILGPDALKMLFIAGCGAFGTSLGVAIVISYFLFQSSSLRHLVVTVATEQATKFALANQSKINSFGLETLEAIITLKQKVLEFFGSQSKKEVRKCTTVGKSLLIPFSFRDVEYELYVPYSGTLARKKNKYYTVSNETKTLINHCNGIKLLVNAEDIGVDEIVSDCEGKDLEIF